VSDGSPPRTDGPLLGSDRPLAEAYDLALLDLDGVVYAGPSAVPGAPEALEEARRRGMRLAYVTNNASRPPSTVADHLCELGIPADVREVVTSAQAAASLLATRHPGGSPVLVVGGVGLRQALTDVGLVPVDSADDDPVAVVQGFGPDVGWRQLAEGAHAVRAGVPWLATNLDLTVPTDRGPAPGNGTLVAAVRVTTGVEPEVAGKPEPPLFAEAVRRCGGERPLVIGDRLDTDLEGARRGGYDGLLVLTGISTVRDALEAGPHLRPHYVGRDLAALLRPHVAPRREGSTWVCGSATASATGSPAVLDVTGGGDEALAAACAAAWEAADDGRELKDGPLPTALSA
jgi:glycerol-1-phosphatase